MLKRTLTAIVLASSTIAGCGQSKQPSAPITAQSYSDETLKIAKAKIDDGEYNSAIRILEGYATNNSNSIAERNFLLGEANLKSISSSNLMSLWAEGGSPRLNEEYRIAVKEFGKTHSNAWDYFRTAIELNPELENRLKWIYLVKNGRLVDKDLFESVLIARLKDFYTSYDNPSLLNLINTEAYDIEAIRKNKLSFLDGQEQAENSKFFPKLPKGISVNLKGRALEREKERFEREAKEEKENADREFKDQRIKIKEDFDAKKEKVSKMSAFELLKLKKIKEDFDIDWLKEDEVVILKRSEKEAEFLTIELSGRPELHIVKVELDENDKLKPFIVR